MLFIKSYFDVTYALKTVQVAVSFILQRKLFADTL